MAIAVVAVNNTLSQDLSAKTCELQECNIPLKGTERCCSLRRRAHVPETHAIAQEYCQRNESCEPEERRECLYGQYGELVMRNGVGESPWHDDEVYERQNSPYGVEDEEVYLSGRCGMPVL